MQSVANNEHTETETGSAGCQPGEAKWEDVRNERVEKVMDSLGPKVLDYVREAVEYCHDRFDTIRDQEWLDNPAFQKRLKTAVLETLERNGSFRLSLSSAAYRHPYEADLPDGLKSQILAGDVGFLELCNNDTAAGTRYMPIDILDPDACDCMNLRVPYHAFTPIAMRSLYAYHSGETMSRVRGDNARGIGWNVLWDVLSAPRVHSREGEARFDLTTAALVAKNVSVRPRKPSTDYALYYDCPENSMGRKKTEFMYCGVLFPIVSNLANAWNAMVYVYNGRPRPGTPAYKAMEPQLYSESDCQSVIAALSLAYQQNPERSEEFSSICYGLNNGHVPQSQMTTGLRQPVMTITAENFEERVQQAKQNYKPYTKNTGEWDITKQPDNAAAPAEDASITVGAVISNELVPREFLVCDQNGQVRNMLGGPDECADQASNSTAVDDASNVADIDTVSRVTRQKSNGMFKLFRPEKYAWEHARDLTVKHVWESNRKGKGKGSDGRPSGKGKSTNKWSSKWPGTRKGEPRSGFSRNTSRFE